MPWPISDLPMMTVTVSSGATRTKALGCKRGARGLRRLPNWFSAKRMPTYRPSADDDTADEEVAPVDVRLRGLAHESPGAGMTGC